ncbi:MAG TPA: MFS transporter [Verrucomicrobiae bacterium]
MNPSPEPPPLPTTTDPRLWPIATVMAAGIFATTFVQTQSLGYLPLNALLTHMGLDSDKAATFFSVAMLPWSFKIIAGLLVDGVPIFGSRRRSYLLLSALTAAGLWLMMGLAPSHYTLLLALAFTMNAAIVFGSTTSGGLLVEAGQRFNMSGRMSSLRTVAQFVGAGLASVISGWIADHTMSGKYPLLWTSVAAMVPLLGMFLAAWFFLHEPPAPPRPDHGRSFVEQMAHVGRSIWAQIRNVLRPEMLLPALLLFFIQAVPTFRSTCFYQYQTGTLHYNNEQVGWLTLAGYAASLLSSGFYAWWCRKASLRVSLYGAVITTALSALPYLFYTSDMPRAVVLECIGNFLQILAYLPLFDIAVRSTPKGSEALGYSLLIGVWNIGLMIGAKTGPTFYEHVFHQNINSVIWLNAGVTLAGLIIVFFLPKQLVRQREGNGG